MKNFIPFLLVVGVFVFVVGYILGNVAGHREGRESAQAFQKEYQKMDCHCGASQTCSFGPGIVGYQTCQTGTRGNVWSRCEPR